MLRLLKITVSTLLILVFVFACTSLSAQPVENSQNENDYYKVGLKLAEQGEVKKALQIWLQTKARLKIPVTRIGVGFIKVVTEHDLKKYYGFATLMYNWGLSTEKVKPNKKALRKIIERVGNLVEYEKYRKWDEMLEDNNPAIYKELRQFWQKMDLTPATTYNERLIEHWQRINYAQKHFSKDDYTIFGTDDRTKIYVRYGKPDFITKGELYFNMGAAKSYIRTMAAKAAPKEIFLTANLARSFHRFPKYEIWVYKSSLYRKKKLIFIFGKASGVTDGFRLVHSVGELIPRSAYSVPTKLTYEDILNVDREPIKTFAPATVLQALYYRQLAYVDPYFRHKYTSIMSATTGFIPPDRRTARNISSDAEFDAFVVKSRAQKEASVIARKMANIPLKVYTYRQLSRSNQPVLLTFIVSKPYKAFWVDYINNYRGRNNKILSDSTKSRLLKYYRYYHVVQLYNKEGTLVKQIHNTPTIIANNKSSISTFSIPAIGSGAEMMFIARLENQDHSSTYSVKICLSPVNFAGWELSE